MGSLTAAQTTVVLQRIAAWRLAPQLPVACPVCAAMGIEIEDRSVRPYAEWYLVACARCGLRDTLHLAMSAPPSAWD